MNLFTRNSPYYHLLKYLLFLLKHPVYYYQCRTIIFTENTSYRIYMAHLSSRSLYVGEKLQEVDALVAYSNLQQLVSLRVM
jgi:hypothetical protein